MSKPLLLDLFCGAGGAAVGYYRAGFDVIGVDINPQPHYPFTFIHADVMTLPINFTRFAAIHASPPCQGYSSLNYNLKKSYPMLIPAIRERLIASGVPWVMENVVGAPMEHYVQLCGRHFGLNVFRHRIFETSHLMFSPGRCSHAGLKTVRYGGTVYAVYGHEVGTVAQWSAAMGIDWMASKAEIAESIPPAFTEWIGSQLRAVIHSSAA